MSSPFDPWENPEFAKPRKRKSANRAWRAGRTRVLNALLITAGLYAVYTLIGGDSGWLRIRALGKERADRKAEIAATDERIRALDKRLENIDHTIEEKARNEYGYIGKDEWVYEDAPADSFAVMPPMGAEGVGADPETSD